MNKLRLREAKMRLDVACWIQDLWVLAILRTGAAQQLPILLPAALVPSPSWLPQVLSGPLPKVNTCPRGSLCPTRQDGEFLSFSLGLVRPIILQSRQS